ncbi:membrane frizzled-related protein isoform X1 [Takifugu flavidus]|uniref:Membrane frizzled-related protein n=1 Tax=Takifugu flavidus TaxID=433684 RepID=A0A5C6PER9_9TELE|nr:membrane frizzled-related protein isoform X1 [Takifugu flavidus]TWW76690.1 Membrane frizzled-related protein [Takifugu flavidus]
MSDLSQVAVYSESSDIYKNVFCNPAFELEGEREERVEGFRTAASTPEPTKPAGSHASWGLLRACAARLGAPGCGRATVVVSAAAVLVLVALGVALSLILQQKKGREMEAPLFSTPPDHLSSPGGATPNAPTISANRGQRSSTSSPQPATIPPTRCGAVLTDLEGSFTSPNHPGSYPPNLLCMWVIQVPPPFTVQIHVLSLAVEGPSPCLFDWLEVQEQLELRSVVTRFCGNVAPPTVNTNSSTAWVTFRSDATIAGGGFAAQYRALLPGHGSCSRDEFLCDSSRCLLPGALCDGHPHCQDRTDETNCSHKHKDCGGQQSGPSGSLSSPNHPRNYPHQQLCIWQLSVEEGHVITLSFRNFSLETQDVCEFDYVEVHDSLSTGAGRVLGRFCGTTSPPDLVSSGPHMTVVFVADEGVADSGFNATYQAVSVLDRTCAPSQFACSTGECLQPRWLCDGWNDCPDGADERGCDNSTFPPFASSCEAIEVEMCRGLSYNLTSFPNIWLSISDQREAAALLRQYRVLMDLACFEPLRRLVCGMFLPQCSPQGGVLQPCRSVCSSAEQQCSPGLDLFSFSWPFNCHLLPDSQDPTECSRP